jgi:uncharacterized membrane protein
MQKERLVAFTDGVMAVLITILVLDLHIPHDVTWQALTSLWPVFVSYLLSFVYLAIYWNNHHHMFHLAPHINGGVMWANIHLLFWLSLIPFTTGWMGENHAEVLPTALYGFVLLMAAIAYFVLQNTIIRMQQRNNKQKQSQLAFAVGADTKGKLSPLLYALGIGLSFVNPWLGNAVYALVACMWLVPDRRIENHLLH